MADYNFRHSDIREDFARYRTHRPNSPSNNSTNNSASSKTVNQLQQQQQARYNNNANGFVPKKEINNRIDDDDDDFMMRIVHGSCQRYFDHHEHLDSSLDNANNNQSTSTLEVTGGGRRRRRTQNDNVCTPLLSGCQGTFDDHLDLFTHCRQPLSFLSFFHENQYSNDDAVLDNTVEEDQLLLRAGAYTMPQFCEYCGSHDTKECSPSKCTRPKLYFQKKRPPFMKPDPHVWDPMTDHYIEPKRQQLQQSDHRRNDDSVTIEIDNNNKGRPISPLLVPVTTNSWVSGLFHPPQSV